MKSIIALVSATILLSLLTFLYPLGVQASGPTITASPAGTLTLDSPFTLTATMSGLSKNAVYRLRIALAQSGTTNYFGSTFDGANWHYGSITDGNFLSITTDANGAWGGDIQGKIDSEDPNFTTGSGQYDLKVGRYTQTGTTATWSDPVSVNLSVPPSPTPTPTLAPTVTSPPTNTPKPTATPTIVPTATHIPTKIPTVTLIASLAASESGLASLDAVLAASDEASVSSEESTISPRHKTLVASTSRNGIVFMVLGVIFLVACGIVGFWTFYKRRKELQE